MSVAESRTVNPAAVAAFQRDGFYHAVGLVDGNGNESTRATSYAQASV